MVFSSCSETPSELPLDSYREVIFNVDMTKAINEGSFDGSGDSISLIIYSFEEFELNDENGDDIYSVVISDMIFGKTYEYRFALNDSLETLNGNNRTFTVQNDINIINDYYNELYPTILTFLVNMSHQIELGNFNPESDFLDVAGTFNDWDGSNSHLDEGENKIYQISITTVEAGEEIEFKFRINGSWDSAEFPGGGSNRTYTVIQGENILEYWYSDESGN